MVKIDDYGNYETAWCPGCGNHMILTAVKQALVDCKLVPHEVLICSGIGQAAKAPHYLRCNVFNGLHGRGLPAAIGAKLTNPRLTVLVESGDGCSYGEGGNHLLAAMRRNHDITMLVHDNQIYGLTKGQASPTSAEGTVTKAQPQGSFAEALNPVELAVTMQAGFVARAFSGMTEHLTGIISAAIDFRGFALIDILQPCVSFNKVNTFSWYKNRCYQLPDTYDPTDFELALRTAREWGENIPVGIIYTNDRPPYESNFPQLTEQPLTVQRRNNTDLVKLLEEFY